MHFNMNTPRKFLCASPLKKVGPTIVAITLCLSASAYAVDYTRVTDAAAAGNWTDTTKWNPSSSFPQTVSDSAIFNSNATQRIVTLDTNITIGLLGTGFTGSSAAQTGNIRLEGAGTSLTVGSVSSPGSIYIGAGNATTTGVTTGTLTLASGVTMNLLGANSAFYIGGQSASSATSSASSGSVLMQEGAAVNLGSGTARSQWFIGRQYGTGANTARGDFTATGGDLTAYLTTLVVGDNLRGSNSTSTHIGSGTLNLSGTANATIDTTSLVIARSNETSAYGNVSLGLNSSLTVGSGTAEIGVRTGGNSARTPTNTVSGLLTLKNGSEMTFGSGTSRTAVVLGSNNGRGGSVIVAEGSVIAEAGSTFSGRMSSLTLGSQVRTETTGTTLYRATGIVDLRSANVSTFDVSGNVTIGYHSGTGRGSQGELRLPETYAVIGGNLIVGDSEIAEGSQVASSGLLDLVGTHVEVQGNATFNLTGRANVVVNGQSAGLRLDSDSTFTLTLAGTSASDVNSAYHITFEEPEMQGLYYGFAWEGNHLTEVQSLVDSFRITWSNNMSDYNPGVFYDSDSDLTYIGAAVPEPSTVAFLVMAAGGGLVLHVRRRNRKA